MTSKITIELNIEEKNQLKRATANYAVIQNLKKKIAEVEKQDEAAEALDMSIKSLEKLQNKLL